MRFISRSTGAVISALGAILVLCGALLPTYGPGDYEPAGFQKAPLLVIAMLIVPALLVLVSSIMAWFRPLPRWFVALCLVVVILAFGWHILISRLAPALMCFDVCPPGGVGLGTGFWLPLVGFPLCAIGLLIAAATEQPRSLHGPPTASA